MAIQYILSFDQVSQSLNGASAELIFVIIDCVKWTACISCVPLLHNLSGPITAYKNFPLLVILQLL